MNSDIKFSKADFWRAAIIGEAAALLSLPVLKNIKVFELLALMAPWLTYLFLALWLTLLSPAVAFGLYIVYRVAVFKWPVVFALGKYGLIGWLNVFLSAGIFNFFILITGIAKGWLADVFLAVAFVITITHSFFWNKFWTFGANNTNKGKAEYLKFLSVTGATALLNLFLLHIIINVVGAPEGFDEKIWANISLAILIPISFLGNFFGSKFFVFKKSPEIRYFLQSKNKDKYVI